MEAYQLRDMRAQLALSWMKQLYELEGKWAASSASERLMARRNQSVPVLEKLRRWLDEQSPYLSKKSALGQAVQYMSSQWGPLTLCLTDGAIPLDNNHVERQIRYVVMGRNRWLFAGSRSGLERAAILYTLLGNCRLASVNPAHWLADVCTRRLKGWPTARMNELLPQYWTPQSQ